MLRSHQMDLVKITRINYTSNPPPTHPSVIIQSSKTIHQYSQGHVWASHCSCHKGFWLLPNQIYLGYLGRFSEPSRPIPITIGLFGMVSTLPWMVTGFLQSFTTKEPKWNPWLSYSLSHDTVYFLHSIGYYLKLSYLVIDLFIICPLLLSHRSVLSILFLEYFQNPDWWRFVQ